MKLWVLSDLHLEHCDMAAPDIPDADVCVVAGDVLTKGVVPSIRWLADKIARWMPVVFVAGNHEHYGGFLDEGLENARMAALEVPRLHFLENDCWKFQDVAFIGMTLWTDFALMGPPEIAMVHSQLALTDYVAIRYSKHPFSKLLPAHTLRRHRESLRFVERALVENAASRRVIVTHHAPSGKSIPEEFKNDVTSSAFASNLETLTERNSPEVWIHGHVHQKLDYLIGNTRVVCNPRGYPGESCFRSFDAAYVMEC